MYRYTKYYSFYQFAYVILPQGTQWLCSYKAVRRSLRKYTYVATRVAGTAYRNDLLAYLCETIQHLGSGINPFRKLGAMCAFKKEDEIALLHN